MKDENEKKEKDESGKNRIVSHESIGAVVAVFSLLALFILLTGKGVFGDLGNAIKTFLLGVFGYGSYAVLPTLVGASSARFLGKKIFKNKRALIFVIFTVLVGLLLVHHLTTFSWKTGKYVSACFNAAEGGAKKATVFGALGASIVFPLRKALGNVGAAIVLSLVLLGFSALTARFLFGKRWAERLVEKIRAHKEKKQGAKKENHTAQPEREIYAENRQANGGATLQERYENGSANREKYREQSSPYFDSAKRVDETAYGFAQENDEKDTPLAGYYGETSEPMNENYRPAEVKQTPGVRLSDSRSGGNAFSPFGYNSFPDEQKEPTVVDKKYLLGASPAEIYRKNLIFDKNAKVNQRGSASSRPSNPSIGAGQSYTDAYADSINRGDIRPQKIVEDERPQYRPPVQNVKSVEAENTNGFSSVRPSENAFEQTPRTNSPSTQREEFSAPTQSERADAYIREHRIDVERSDFSARDRSREDEISQHGIREEDVFSRREKENRTDEETRFQTGARNLFDDEPKDESYLSRSEREEGERSERPFRFEEIPEENEKEESRGRDIFDEEKEDPYSLNTDFLGGGDRSTRSERAQRSASFERRESRLGEDNRSIRADREERSLRVQRREQFTAFRVEPSDDEDKPITPPTPPKPKVIRPYQAPPLSFFDLTDVIPDTNALEVEQTKEMILDTLSDYKVNDASIASVTFGPTVTRFNVAIPRNISPKKVVSLDQEIAISLHAARGVNIYPNFEDGAVSIEVPNKHRQFVTLGCMLADEKFMNASPNSLTFAMGKDVGNKKIYGDIRKMTHILVAGTSGSGKSVFLHSLITSLICRYSPADLRLIIIDPKRTEFVVYDHIPHLIINEIISEPRKVIQSLSWAIAEMQRRYALFEQKSRSGTYVVDIDEYNANLVQGEKKLPKIVIVVDELADLILAARRDVEEKIQNLTQKSRATGIHMILATQRPSTDVITGVIKSNLKTRIALSVATDIDSRVILDMSGANKLLGKGDMLYTTEGDSTAMRLQSPSITSEEKQRVVQFIKDNNDCDFDDDATTYINNTRAQDSGSGSDDEVDEVYINALRCVILSGSASISMIERKCSVGYNKAGRIIEWMEEMGYISTFDGAKARKVLISKEEFEEKYGEL